MTLENSPFLKIRKVRFSKSKEDLKNFLSLNKINPFLKKVIKTLVISHSLLLNLQRKIIKIFKISVTILK